MKNNNKILTIALGSVLVPFLIKFVQGNTNYGPSSTKPTVVIDQTTQGVTNGVYIVGSSGPWTSTVTVQSPNGNTTPIPVTILGAPSTTTVNLGFVGGTAVSLGETDSAGSIPVVIANDQSPILVKQSESFVVIPGTGTWNATGSTVNIQGTVDTNLAKIGGTAVGLGATTGSASLPVVLPTDMQALVVISTSVGAPALIKVTATGVSATLSAANAARVGIECDTDCSNTDDIYIGFGGAATANGKVMKPCSSWNPPSGYRFTALITVISASGSQVIRCIEY